MKRNQTKKKKKYIQYKPREIKAINAFNRFLALPINHPKMYDNLYASNFVTLYYQYKSVRL